MSQLTGRTIGGYRIIEQIGLGGMATVYKAYQPAIDRYVAFKVISTYLAQDPTFIKRFEREAKVIAKLEHAHILPVYDYGEAEGQLYLVMRFIDGGTLKERLKDGPLSLAETCRVVNQVGAALEYTHQLNVIHRDLKPSNVLIDAQGDCYLTDFGIAKMVESSAGLTGSGVVGTPHYMAPEQGAGKTVDRRADVYSMGVVIYELLTRRVPFDAETPVAVMIKHITEPLPLPRTLRPDLPEAVERVLLKALAKEPNHRYQTMRELVIAFDDAVQTAPAKLRTLTSAPAQLPPADRQATPVGRQANVPWGLLAAILAIGLVLIGLAALGGFALFNALEPSNGNATPTATAVALVSPPAAEIMPSPTAIASANDATPTALPAVMPTETPPPPTPQSTPVVASTATSQPEPTVAPTSTPRPQPTATLPPLTVQAEPLAQIDGGLAKRVAWSPDGSRLAVASTGLHLYSTNNFSEQLALSGSDWVYDIAFSSAGQTVATAFMAGQDVTLWTIDGGQVRTFPGSQEAARIAFSPDDRLLAATIGGVVRLWDANSGQELRTIPTGNSAGPVAFSPDGTLLAAMAGTAGQDIKVWETTGWTEPYTLNGHTNWVKSIAFAPDGKTIATGSVDQSIRLWDTATGRQVRVLAGHTGQIEEVAFSPDGRLLASGSWDLTVRLWDVASGAEVAQLTGHTGWINTVAFSPDGTMLASGANDQTVRVWRVTFQ